MIELIQIIVLFLLFTAIYYFSRRITNRLYSLSMLILHNSNISVWLLSLFLLPGTIIHELSHFFVATILRVPTGELSIFPEVVKSGEVRAGKLMLGRTDPFRLSLIGLAPIITGLITIYVIGIIFFSDINSALILNSEFLIRNSFFYYLLFVVSVTMFSSKKDLESLLVAGPLTFFFILVLYLVGIRFFLEGKALDIINSIITKLNSYLLISAIICLSVSILLNLLHLIISKLLGSQRKRIITSKD